MTSASSEIDEDTIAANRAKMMQKMMKGKNGKMSKCVWRHWVEVEKWWNTYRGNYMDLLLTDRRLPPTCPRSEWSRRPSGIWVSDSFLQSCQKLKRIFECVDLFRRNRVRHEGTWLWREGSNWWWRRQRWTHRGGLLHFCVVSNIWQERPASDNTACLL